MSPLKTSLIATLVSIAVTSAGLYHFHQRSTGEVRRLLSQNNRMRLEANLRHHAQAAARVASAEWNTIESTASPSVVTTSPPETSAEYYRNEGNATPLATLQTFAWACDRGDVAMVSRLLHIDATARAKVAAFMAGLPETTRAQWKTVDEIAAAGLTHSLMARPFPNADILETATEEPVSEGRVRLRMPNVPKDGTEYQRTTEGWKFVLTEAMVDGYIRQMR